ncbi:hypothetical protein QVD17_30124 [Tagetes erecta]|uniref:Uncharacterized protein n=1 Tax=Tagetes erecta TaxID=13708 RepID=A0AAD8K0Y8_TARER|nr:hypothetical protein QVD17_30124 [Tagetes erecta]
MVRERRTFLRRSQRVKIAHEDPQPIRKRLEMTADVFLQKKQTAPKPPDLPDEAQAIESTLAPPHRLEIGILLMSVSCVS